MIKIAILGFGVVGGGIAAVLEENKAAVRTAVGDEIAVKYILDLREFPGTPYEKMVVHSIDPILADPEVKIVCETMGGAHPAFEYSVAAMKAGKSVVTSNKEVVATFGVELNRAAAENGVSYLFEASVGGGIPLIRSIRTSLSGDKIDRIDGIMNGTTNYIITKMKNDGADFASVLKEAQALGYAEKNPTADVDGIDTQRKITILTALATGKLLRPEQVYAETMTRLTRDDMDAAAAMGATVRLIGSFREKNGKIAAWVCPSVVMNTNPLAHVEDVYNAVSVNSPITGDVMYYGRGAGRFPTAGAMVSDLVAAAKGAASKEAVCNWAPTDDVILFDDCRFAHYVRLASDSPAETLESARLVLGELSPVAAPDGAVAFVTGLLAEGEISRALAGDALGKVLSRIRVLGA